MDLKGRLDSLACFLVKTTLTGCLCRPVGRVEFLQRCFLTSLFRPIRKKKEDQIDHVLNMQILFSFLFFLHSTPTFKLIESHWSQMI